MLVRDAVTGGPVPALSREGALAIHPVNQRTVKYTLPALVDGVAWNSPVIALPPEPRPRLGVAAQMYSAIQNATGSTIEIQWSETPTGPWIPAISSATGDARTSKVSVTNADRSMISRGQPSGSYVRVQIVMNNSAQAAGAELFVQYGFF